MECQPKSKTGIRYHSSSLTGSTYQALDLLPRPGPPSVPLVVEAQEREGARRVDGYRQGRHGLHVRFVELAPASHTQKTEGGPDLFLEELQDADQSRLTGRSESVALQAPDAHRIGAESEGLHDVGAAVDGAVIDDRGPTFDRGHHFHQGLDR